MYEQIRDHNQKPHVECSVGFELLFTNYIILEFLIKHLI